MIAVAVMAAAEITFAALIVTVPNRVEIPAAPVMVKFPVPVVIDREPGPSMVLEKRRFPPVVFNVVVPLERVSALPNVILLLVIEPAD